MKLLLLEYKPINKRYRHGKSSNKKIIKRDDYACRICGSREFGLQVHHIKPVFLGGTYDKENLLTLCIPCHKFMHANPMLVIKTGEYKSEATKLGLERAKLQGKKLGRPFGAKDTKKRRIVGYSERWK